jgi:DNA-binding NarL/FixJ family response regulator
VLIVDDHQLIRAGLKLCLEAIERHVTVFEAETPESAVETYLAHPDIDLVMLDLSMPGTQECTALDDFSHACPSARIVVVSATYDMKTVQAAFAKGIHGFIPKLAGRTAFINALRFVLEGGTYIPLEALMPTSAALPNAPAQPVVGRPAALRDAKLTARQIDVLAQLLDGKPNKQICRELNLALGTVKCHVGAILGALEVNSRAEAIAAADKRGWRQSLSQTGFHGGQPA